MPHFARLTFAVVLGGCLTGSAVAEPKRVTVTVRNTAPANSLSFAPLRLGFHNGTFDAFDAGRAATAPIISVAEGGAGTDWFPAFRAAEPAAVLGSVGGALLPGRTASQTFVVDPAVNAFFTFATMVIPSNDLFLGNDSPSRFRLFDAAGNLTLDRIDQFGRDVWDAGSEVADPLNAAFLADGNNDLRTPQNGVVRLDLSELASYQGRETRGGYTFDARGVGADTGVYEIRFAAAPTPEPATLTLLGIGGLGVFAANRLRRRAARPA